MWETQMEREATWCTEQDLEGRRTYVGHAMQPVARASLSWCTPGEGRSPPPPSASHLSTFERSKPQFLTKPSSGAEEWATSILGSRL